MKISDTIKKEKLSLEERGRSSDSFFILYFSDGSIISEEECNWSDISTPIKVKYQDGFKTVHKCNYQVSKIIIRHNELRTEVETEGLEFYQQMRGQATVLNGGKDTQVSGRCVGIIKDGEVVEERVLNGFEGVVQGWRK